MEEEEEKKGLFLILLFNICFVALGIKLQSWSFYFEAGRASLSYPWKL